MPVVTPMLVTLFGISHAHAHICVFMADSNHNLVQVLSIIRKYTQNYGREVKDESNIVFVLK